MLKNFLAVLDENRSWLLLAVLIFSGGFILSYLALSQDPTLIKTLEEAMLTVLQDLSETVFSGSRLQGMITLFMHNLMSTMYVMFLGIIIGLPSLMSALANGSVLGLVAYQLSQQGVSPLPFLLAGVLPHGLFELPAFFVSVALGLKIGYHIIFPLPGSTRLESLRVIFREIGASLPFIVGLLAVASAIEVFITPLIIRPFL